MRKKNICIIGCGTYGSYLLKRILDLYKGQVELTIIEIGNEKTKSEQEIGLKSTSEFSNVASAGRYFGLGGTSARWGGQILFFDERDNPENDPVWNEIIRINSLYYKPVIQNLLGATFNGLVHHDKDNVKVG